MINQRVMSSRMHTSRKRKRLIIFSLQENKCAVNSYWVSLVKIDSLSLEFVKEKTWETGHKNSALEKFISSFCFLN